MLSTLFPRLRATLPGTRSTRAREEAASVAQPDHTAPNVVSAVNTTKGTVVAERVVWATGAAKTRGLLGHERLEPHEGMYIVPTQWVHMFGMRFPIDVAFLARDGRVLAVHRGLRPNRLSRPVLRAEGALELAAGRLHDTRTTVGDRIEFLQP